MIAVARRFKNFQAMIKTFGLVFAQVENPLPLILDRLGLKRGIYTIQLRGGPRFELRSGTTDRYSVYETALREEGYFEFSTISPGDTVIDIGANIGVFTVLAARLVGPTGRVISIEPHPETSAILRQNIALNGLSNARVKQVGVSGNAGRMSLHTGDQPLFSSFMNEVNGKTVGGRSEEVSVVTLSGLLAEEKIEHVDFLKIDCEGSEYSIFDTAPTALWSKISHIVMEAHYADGRKTSELVQKLRAEGFDVRERDLIYASRAASVSS
jgi:FkbM family methyltransferase